MRWLDLKYGVRFLLGSPGATALAVLALALGIGANIAIFSMADAVLFRALPGVARPTELIQLGRTTRGSGFGTLAYPDYQDFRDQFRTLSDLAAYFESPLSLSAEVADA